KGAFAAQSAQSLGAIAARNGIVFGAAAGPVIDKDHAYRELYQTQTRIVTTDIAMKMGTIAPQPGPKRFESADRLLQFCASNNIPMRGHCLIWNEWVPQWIRSMSGAEREKFFDSYIVEVAARYIGKLHSWEVVLTVRKGLLQLVDELKHAGVPLHAVGLQSHLQPRYPHDPGRFAEFLHALAERGVDIYLTEFDVRDDTFPDDIAARDAMIAE